jgi:diguanylate cyclase (GGDEF)-like protein/PAS domain S-box-containing protein
MTRLEATQRILIVEDDPNHAKLISSSFESVGRLRWIRIVRSLAEARQHVAEWQPDLIISDLNLPDGSGAELLPGADARGPIVIMTSHGDERAAVAAMRTGAIDYVVKTAVTLSQMPRIAEQALRDWNHTVERERMATALRESEEHHRSLIENALDLIVVLAPNHVISYMSPSARHVLGYDPHELIGKSALELISPDEHGEFVRMLEALFDRSDVTHSDVLRVRTKSGDWRIIEAIGRSRQLGADKVAVVNARDITDRREAEEALTKALGDAQRVSAELSATANALERRAAEGVLLNEMRDTLQASDSMRDAYQVVARYTKRLFPDDSGVLGILSEDGSQLEMVARWGTLPWGAVKMPATDCLALRDGRLQIVRHGATEGRCPHLRASSQDSICAPLMAGGKALGSLHLQQHCREAELPARAPDQFLSPDRTQLALSAAGGVALALANIRLRESLRAQAIRDPLTGLFNRRFLQEVFDKELQRSVRANTALSLITLDIDHFKRINDLLGHDAGDAVLRSLGDLLRQKVRSEDFVVRLGGDEFVIVMPAAGSAVATARAEGLRRSASRARIDYRDSDIGPVTISLGVATLSRKSATLEEVLRAADRALYEAKSAGRNSVATRTVGHAEPNRAAAR